MRRFSHNLPGRAAILALIICASLFAGCSAKNELYGNYIFEKQIYMNSLSSFLALDGYVQYYTFDKDNFTITEISGEQRSIKVTYKKEEFDEQAFRDSFIFGPEIEVTPDISSYKERQQYTLTDSSGSAVYRVYLLDGDIWLAQVHYANVKKSEYIWYIYKIRSFDGKLPS